VVHPRGDPTGQLPCALRVFHPSTRAHVRLLGPCFKTGRMGSPRAGARSALVPRGGTPLGGRALPSTVAATAFPRASRRPELGPPPRSAPVRAPSRSADRPRGRSASDRGASPTPIRFPPDNFKHSLTLFSKSFSSFPRGTCSLSVSRPYLALDGIYRPIGAAFPNNPTRRQRLVVRQGPGTTGLSPSPAPLSRELEPGPPLRTLLQTTIRTPGATDSHAGLFPVRSPLLGESSLVSFPPLIDMLKLSGWSRLTWGRRWDLGGSRELAVERIDRGAATRDFSVTEEPPCVAARPRAVPPRGSHLGRPGGAGRSRGANVRPPASPPPRGGRGRCDGGRRGA
jgi:hypothetical protein